MPVQMDMDYLRQLLAQAAEYDQQGDHESSLSALMAATEELDSLKFKQCDSVQKHGRSWDNSAFGRDTLPIRYDIKPDITNSQVQVLAPLPLRNVALPNSPHSQVKALAPFAKSLLDYTRRYPQPGESPGPLCPVNPKPGRTRPTARCKSWPPLPCLNITCREPDRQPGESPGPFCLSATKRNMPLQTAR